MRLGSQHFILRAYEDLLLKMGEKNSDGGQFFAPREVIRAMVHTLGRKLGDTIYAPCCGTGGFLAVAYEHIARIDDFLIENKTQKRIFPLPEYHRANPVLAPDQPWEKSGRPRAACFSDGFWFDPQDGLFKMWYWASLNTPDNIRCDTCLATSLDGIRWDKPAFDVVPGTNIVLRDEEGLGRNSNTVWLDHAEKDPKRRFKTGPTGRLRLAASRIAARGPLRAGNDQAHIGGRRTPFRFGNECRFEWPV